MKKIVTASATLAQVIMQEMTNEEKKATPNGGTYFRSGWTNAKSDADYVDRLTKNRTAPKSGKYKFTSPRVVKPSKILNNRRGVPIRSLYLEGKDECLIGKAPSVTKDVTFLVNPDCSSDIKKEQFEKFAEVILDAWDTLVEAGYSPQFALICGGEFSNFESVIKIDCPNIDREQVRHMINDIDSCRYLGFKAEDCFLSYEQAGYKSRPRLIDKLYDGQKGQPMAFTKDHLSMLGLNPLRTVGSFVGLKGGDIDYIIKKAFDQLQAGMLAL
jgi:hypothetical protein